MRSYHALWVEAFRFSCSSGVEPKCRRCRLHGRGRKHPRVWLSGLQAHVQRQCVFLRGPGHRGLCSGPRRVADRCGAAYLIRKKVAESGFFWSWTSHNSSASGIPITARIFFRCIAHTTNAKRLVITRLVEPERSHPSTSTHVCHAEDFLPRQLYVPEPQ